MYERNGPRLCYELFAQSIHRIGYKFSTPYTIAIIRSVLNRYFVLWPKPITIVFTRGLVMLTRFSSNNDSTMRVIQMTDKYLRLLSLNSGTSILLFLM